MKSRNNKKIMKVTLATLAMFAVMLIGGNNYMYNNGLSGKYINTEPKEGQIKVACVGDSTTYGHGIEDWTKNSYPVVLQSLLGEKYHVSNFGSSGACVNPDGDQPYNQRPIYQGALDYDADIVVIMIGTNDAKPENWTNEEDFIDDYITLLASFTAEEKSPEIYVVLPPEAFYTTDEEKESGISTYDIQPAKVDELVAALKEYAENSDIVKGVIDIHTLTESHPEWFEIDGIHPSNDGAKAFAETIAQAIQSQE